VKAKSERAVNIGLLVLALTGLVVGSILADVFKVLIAVAIAYGVLRLVLAMLRNLARPLPEPPDPGILRKVKIEYRCAICGAEVRMKRALNCRPWVRSLIHSPDVVIHSPAPTMAAWPTTVTRSRWPRALIRSTQKPFSGFWNGPHSTGPARSSRSGDSACWPRPGFTMSRAPER